MLGYYSTNPCDYKLCPYVYNNWLSIRDIPSESFNCAGLAFRTFNWLTQDQTKAVLKHLKPISCSRNCGPCSMKVWYWENTDKPDNFHVVGSQVDKCGRDPKKFYSKDGGSKIIYETIKAISKDFRPTKLSCYCGSPDVFRRAIQTF